MDRRLEIELRLAQSPAPLPTLTAAADALNALVIAASWPSFCLDDQPEAWAIKHRLSHDLHHVLAEARATPGAIRRPGAQLGAGDLLRVATLLDALESGKRGAASGGRFVKALEAELCQEKAEMDDDVDLITRLDDLEGSLLEGRHVIRFTPLFRNQLAPSDRFFARYFRAEVARMRPEYQHQLEILDLRTASPPRLRVGVSTSILTAGAATAVALNPACGISVMLLGLIDAVLVIRANFADVRGREADARVKEAQADALVARERVREQLYVASQGELERSPEVVELVVKTAMPAVLGLSDGSVGALRALSPDGEKNRDEDG